MWHYCPEIPYIPWTVGVVVLTDNTLKYKEFIVTCNMKTHYVSPLILNYYHKSKLTTTRFYCFTNVKLKRSPKNLELDISVAKNGQFLIFHGKQQIPRHGMKIRVPWNTAGPVYYCRRY